VKDTAEQSAALKMALKHDPMTPELEQEAKRFPLEADEAFFEVQNGHDTCHPDSWVAEQSRLAHES
jgi:hypothetical protein